MISHFNSKTNNTLYIHHHISDSCRDWLILVLQLQFHNTIRDGRDEKKLVNEEQSDTETNLPRIPTSHIFDTYSKLYLVISDSTSDGTL